MAGHLNLTPGPPGARRSIDRRAGRACSPTTGNLSELLRPVDLGEELAHNHVPGFWILEVRRVSASGDLYDASVGQQVNQGPDRGRREQGVAVAHDA